MERPSEEWLLLPDLGGPGFRAGNKEKPGGEGVVMGKDGKGPVRVRCHHNQF